MKWTKEQKARMLDKMVIKERLHKPDEWFTQEVIADGNHIQIFVNGKKTVDFIEREQQFHEGALRDPAARADGGWRQDV